MIKRDLYLNRLISKRHNGMIKVITGMRRSGKSYLLFNIYYDWLRENGIEDDQVIRIALDDIENEMYRDPHALYERVLSLTSNGQRQYYVFLDEVQYAISAEELKDPGREVKLYGVLNGFLRRENIDVYVTGSNSKLLSTDVMTEFRGREDELHIAPLSFSEYYPAHGGSKEEAWTDYSYYGGLPHILEEKTEESKISYLNRLNAEIYLRDISERYGIKNSDGMRELMQVLASSIGSLTNPKKIADTFKSTGQKGISAPTISEYLQYLQDAFVVKKAKRYDVKGRRYISTPSKYYYSDMGLRNALLNFRQYEEPHIMENVIYNELIYRGFNVDVGVVELNTREKGENVHKRLEVDFVANLGSRRYYIQSAFSIPDQEKLMQEQAPFKSIPDSFKKIIVVKDRTPLWRNEQGVTIMNIYDFLLNNQSLDL